MAALTIRNLDESLKQSLRIRAAEHGRSMEEEVRVILRSALATDTAPTHRLADRIRLRFQAHGGAELATDPREPLRANPLDTDNP